MSELKVCPCCGSKAKLNDVCGRWAVTRTGCSMQTGCFNEQESPIATWNRRTEPNEFLQMENYLLERKIIWLKRYGTLEMECTRLRGEIEEWHSTAERTTRALSAMPMGGGQGGSIIELAVGEIAELELDLTRQLRIKTALRREIEQAVARIEDEKLEHLLRLRYIKGLRWREVAEAMFYSNMQIMRLHKAALAGLRVPGIDPDGGAASVN